VRTKEKGKLQNVGKKGNKQRKRRGVGGGPTKGNTKPEAEGAFKNERPISSRKKKQEGEGNGSDSKAQARKKRGVGSR